MATSPETALLPLVNLPSYSLLINPTVYKPSNLFLVLNLRQLATPRSTIVNFWTILLDDSGREEQRVQKIPEKIRSWAGIELPSNGVSLPPSPSFILHGNTWQ
jgi:hypothetical protein